MDAYERALLEAGGQHKFQLRYSIVYNLILVACVSAVYMNVVMVLTVPPHSCRIPATPINYTEEEWKHLNVPLERNSKGKIEFSSCRIYINGNVNETTECNEGYDYDETWYHSTAASINDWVCNQELLVADAFAYSRIGEVVGSLGMGWMGDKYGRKTLYIVSLALMISGRAITAFSSGSFVVFLCGSVIAALPSTQAGQATMVISLETSTAENRAKIVMIQNIGWALGLIVLPLFYWWLRDWFPFLLITTLTLVPFFMMSWQLTESPRWLWTMGQQKACLKQLRHIANVNAKTIRPEVERALLEQSPDSDPPALGPLALFSNTTLALNTILILTLWFCSVACYAVITMRSGEGDTEGNPFVRFAWQALAEIPGYLVGAYLADRCGRRFTVCSSLGVAALISASFVFIAPDLQQNSMLSMVQLMGGKLCVTATYYVTSLVTMEIYPTCLRQTGLSCGTVLAGAAFALTPYILYLGRRVDVRLPALIVTIFCAVGGVAGFLLPETLHAALPETLQEAQMFGADRRKHYFKLPQKITDENPKVEKQEYNDFSQQKN